MTELHFIGVVVIALTIPTMLCGRFRQRAISNFKLEDGVCVWLSSAPRPSASRSAGSGGRGSNKPLSL